MTDDQVEKAVAELVELGILVEQAMEGGKLVYFYPQKIIGDDT